jgi:hypothetical protein
MTEIEGEEEPFVPAPQSWFEEEQPVDDASGIDTRVRSPKELPLENGTLTDHCVFQSRQTPTRSFRDRTMESARRKQVVVRQQDVGSPLPSPSWNEISSQVLPLAAKELLTSSFQRICYLSRKTYYKGLWHRQYSELGNNTGGYFRDSDALPHSVTNHDNVADGDRVLPNLPPFSCLPWVDRQLVKEWRTYIPHDDDTTDQIYGDETSKRDNCSSDETEEDDFSRARTLVPIPVDRPQWCEAESCHECRKVFGPTRLRHHCRLCGHSYCQAHSSLQHRLPHLGYDPNVPERVCGRCKRLLLAQNLAERVAWRRARCRDYLEGTLTPYFETGVDTLEDVALRITHAALSMAKSIPLGAQATVAVETVDVLRKHGLNGIYTIMLRQEFLAAADLLRKALGINRTAWPLSVHELSAAIFYALAQHRAMRGMNPEREEWSHRIRLTNVPLFPGGALPPLQIADDAAILPEMSASSVRLGDSSVSLKIPVDSTDFETSLRDETYQVEPVCESISNSTLASLIFYAPIALNFIYATKEVDMQLLAAQQGWRLVYAYLEQEVGHKDSDRPASALFVHEDQKIACIAVRGTATIHDIVMDIRQIPVPFPESDVEQTREGDWTAISRGQGLAVCGMAGAAANLYREHIDSLLLLAKQGYRIRLTGHSLGGGVATLLGVLLLRELKRLPEVDQMDVPLRVYSYGPTACVDAQLADFVKPFVTTIIHHDDVVPRMTPESCRGLLKHLLHIRETWVKDHLENDILAITSRAKTAWAPRLRSGFTMGNSSVSNNGCYRSSSSLKRYYRKQMKRGKDTLLLMKEKLIGEEDAEDSTLNEIDLEQSKHVVASLSLSEGNETLPGVCIEKKNQSDVAWHETKMLVDYLGDVDSESEGVVIDGDEFFDTEDLIESESESEDSGRVSDDPIAQSMLEERRSQRVGTDSTGIANSQFTTLVIAALENADSVSQTFAEVHDDREVDDGPGAVILEDSPLPRLYLPGRIAHVYSHRGVYKAAYVPRTFLEIRRISLAGNMLSDHKSEAYYKGLLEVRSVRQATEDPPRWTAFDEDNTWYAYDFGRCGYKGRCHSLATFSCSSCCANRFTWASTSDSEAQEARDKHNCRSCGTLVCNPCSLNRIPLPSIGLTVPTRVCDRCYNDIDGMLTGPKGMTSSYLDDSGIRIGELEMEDASVTVGTRPERQRIRRSTVVDELANRIHSSPLICS